jgi:uncharacterized membrane protein
MKLTDSGESRIRGYLYVFERSLRSFLSPQIAADAVREVESHIRDAMAEAGDVPDEGAALEGILRRLGPPMRVAQAYSLELVLDEAAATGRLLAIFRSLFHVATTGVMAFLAVFGLFVGYAMGIAFIIVAIMKPILPNNVGFWTTPEGAFVSSGIEFPAIREGLVFHTTYWIIPGALLIGFVLLLVTHLLARRWIAWFRNRRKWRSAFVPTFP